MNIKLMTLVAVAAASIATPALAADANGSITVLRPLTITKNADLGFGTVIRPDSGSGTVTVSNAGTRSVANGVVALSSTTASAAQFTIDGEGAQSVSVTIPATFTLNNGSVSGSLTVTTSSNLVNPALVSLDGTLGSAGTKTFNVGGSIDIASTTTSGAYTGTLTVTAAYN